MKKRFTNNPRPTQTRRIYEKKLIALIEEKGDLPPLPDILMNLENKINGSP